MSELISIFLIVVITIIPVVNPLSAAPVFISMTRELPVRGRNLMAKRVAINSFLLIAASLFIGKYVLSFFGLEIAVVQVGGGLLVCAVAWDLLHQDSPTADDELSAKAEEKPMARRSMAKAFYPLTLPVTVGPGSISVAITIGANHANNLPSLLIATPPFLLGAASVAFVIWACFRYAHQLMHLLGSTGAVVVARLFAFLLLCIGVQIIWNGASALLKTL